MGEKAIQVLVVWVAVCLASMLGLLVVGLGRAVLGEWVQP